MSEANSAQDTPIRLPGARHNVLITSASHKAPLLLAAREALHRIDPLAHVVAGDIDPNAPARLLARAFWTMPVLRSETIPAVIDGCKRRSISVILPTRDAELIFWARHAARFRDAGITVIVSDESAIERCLDKLKFARFGQANGLPFISARLMDDCLSGDAWVVKERFGSGARGIGVNLSGKQARAHARTLTAPLLQPFLPGPEISVDGWLDREGVCAGVVLRKRDRVVAGESQITSTFRDAPLERAAARILEALGLRGPVVMQAIHRDGQMHVIECNARFGGASTAAIAVGLDTIHWSLIEAFDLRTEIRFDRARQEIRQVRLPVDRILQHQDTGTPESPSPHATDTADLPALPSPRNDPPHTHRHARGTSGTDDAETDTPGPVFEKILPNAEQARSLYRLLKSRRHSISHTTMPSFREHEAFVRVHPYRCWYLITEGNTRVGAFYITPDNTIGIDLVPGCEARLLRDTLEFAVANYTPNGAIPSIRAGDFSVNISPGNDGLRDAMEQLGLRVSQVSYSIDRLQAVERATWPEDR